MMFNYELLGSKIKTINYLTETTQRDQRSSIMASRSSPLLPLGFSACASWSANCPTIRASSVAACSSCIAWIFITANIDSSAPPEAPLLAKPKVTHVRISDDVDAAINQRKENDSRLLLFLVCGEQVDPKVTFTFGHVLRLHASHQTSQQIQLLFGQ